MRQVIVRTSNSATLKINVSLHHGQGKVGKTDSLSEWTSDALASIYFIHITPVVAMKLRRYKLERISLKYGFNTCVYRSKYEDVLCER